MINEQLLSECIEESAHKIDNQNELSKEIANVVYKNLYNCKSENEPYQINIDISEFKVYSDNIIVNVTPKHKLANVSGNITDFNPLEISLFVPVYWDLMDKDTLIFKIQTTIAHELMHGNIYTKKYNAIKHMDIDYVKKCLNDYPQYYEDIAKFIIEYTINDIYYDFAYALYTSYYHEMQSIINQSDIYFRRTLSNIKNINNNTLKYILYNCDEYNIFVSNISLVQEIRNMNEQQVSTFINKFNKKLSENNKLNKEILNKLLKKIEAVSYKSLKHLGDLLMDDYYKINAKL